MLDLDTLDADFMRIVQSATGTDPVAMDLAEAYNNYAKGANIAGADCSAGGSLALLESAFSPDNSPVTVLNMASKLCAFWQNLPKPGVPAHGGLVVVTVAPSFQTLNSAVYLAIQNCLTQQPFEQPYKRLFKAIETVLKTAPIAIVETMPTSPPSPSTFTEFLS